MRPGEHLSADGYILLALGVFLLPFRWMAAMILAVIFHELGHLIALKCMGIPVEDIRGDHVGIRICAGEMTKCQELIAVSAGPGFSFLLLLFIRIFPELTFCGLIHGLYNLLPLYPSDGGRILMVLLSRFPENRKNQIFRCAKPVTGICMVMAGITGMCMFRRLSLLILTTTVLLFWRMLRNIPCKQDGKEVK